MEFIGEYVKIVLDSEECYIFNNPDVSVKEVSDGYIISISLYNSNSKNLWFVAKSIQIWSVNYIEMYTDEFKKKLNFIDAEYRVVRYVCPVREVPIYKQYTLKFEFGILMENIYDID